MFHLCLDASPHTPDIRRRFMQVGVLLQTQEKLVTALEEEKAARERERVEQHHLQRQASTPIN